ncbi:MAG: hypothetical protein IPL77_07155 [Flavobacteriales bacterium]|nr:hypothetical protein [Flavobacteriales bacterium]
MTLKLAFLALAVVFIAALAVALVRSRLEKTKQAPSLISFLLGGRQLGKMSIVNLLLSSSFGLNAIFYAAWLGYSIGLWGVVIQAAWAVSFLLLIPYSNKLDTSNSLHDFLGHRFGNPTRKVAALCSLVGMMYLMGWEVGIGEASFQTFFASSSDISTAEALSYGNWFTLAVVVGTLLYTALGGLQGNAAVDKLLNFLKVTILIVVTILLLGSFHETPGRSFGQAVFPSWETMVENLGVWGLITNIIFNLSWQFVDNSTWQSLIAGSNTEVKATRWNLRMSAFAVFLTVGLFGTLLGVALANTEGVTPDNLLALAVQSSPWAGALLTFAMFIVIVACMMSLLDGLLLASALTIVVDLMRSSEGAAAESDKTSALFTTRIALLIVAGLSIWGIRYILGLSGASLFDFVYIVIITQLALFGPVLLGLLTNREAPRPMWLAVVLALIVGFGTIAIGTITETKFLLDGAGTFTILASVLVGLIITYATKSSRTTL